MSTTPCVRAVKLGNKVSHARIPQKTNGKAERVILTLMESWMPTGTTSGNARSRVPSTTSTA